VSARYGTVRLPGGGHAVVDRKSGWPVMVNDVGAAITVHDPDDGCWMELTEEEAEELAEQLGSTAR